MDHLSPEISTDSGTRTSRGFEGDAVAALDRFLGQLVQEAWGHLASARGPTEAVFEYSGILPLPHPGLLPFLDKPGVFILLGPDPTLSVLGVGGSRGPLGLKLLPHLAHKNGFEGGGAPQEGHSPGPAYTACITMDEEDGV